MTRREPLDRALSARSAWLRRAMLGGFIVLGGVGLWTVAERGTLPVLAPVQEHGGDAVALPERSHVLPPVSLPVPDPDPVQATGGSVGWCLPAFRGAAIVSGAPVGLASFAAEADAGTPDPRWQQFAPRWQRPIEDLPSLPGWPVRRDGLVVVGTATQQLVAVSTEDGTVQWRANGVGGRQRPSLLGDRVVHHDGSQVIAVDTATGHELWRSEHAGPRRLIGSVAHANGRVYVAQTRDQQDRFTSASSDLVLVLDLAEGTVVDELELLDPNRAGRPVVVDVAIARGELITLEQDGALSGRHLADGTARWRVPVDRQATTVAAAGTDGSQLAVLVGLQWQLPRGLPDGFGSAPARVAAALGGPCRLQARAP